MLDARAVRRIGGRWAPPAVLAVLCAWQVAVGSSGVVGPPPVVAVAGVIAALLLAARIERPLLVLLLIAAVLLPPALIWGPSQLGAQVLTVVVAVFACGRYGRRPWAWAAAPLASGLVLLQLALDPTQDVGGTAVWALNSIWIFGIGAWLRQKESLVEHARAEAAERARAEAAEHRLQVARELHDVLAHSLSVMVVQAEVADELLDRDPRGGAPGGQPHRGDGPVRPGRDSRAAVRAARRRRRGEGSGRHPRSLPGLADLPALVQRLRSSGLPVVLETGDVDTEAPRGGIPAALGQAVFRLVQEALTNTMRHAGCVPTTVRLRPVRRRPAGGRPERSPGGGAVARTGRRRAHRARADRHAGARRGAGRAARLPVRPATAGSAWPRCCR